MKHLVLKRIALTILVIISIFLYCCKSNPDNNSLQNNFFTFYLPWDDSSETSISLEFLNPYPAGKDGFVYATSGGHLATKAGQNSLLGCKFLFWCQFPFPQKR